MAFNFKAFATAFMDDQAKQIQKRIQDAEDYEDQQREQAERNKSIIGKRRALVNLAKTEINMLRRLGAKDKHINAAIAAGPKVLFEFSQALQKEAQKRPSAGGSYTFSESELDTFIDMPEEFAAASMTPEEHYANSIGLASPSLGGYEAKGQGLLRTALGMGLKDAARARMDRDPYFEGYSIMDINEIARQEAYESMDPGTYFSFRPSANYDPTVIGPAFRDAFESADELPAALEASLRARYKGQELDDAIKAERLKRKLAVVDQYAKKFQLQFLEDTSIDVRGEIGDTLYYAMLDDYKSSEELEKLIVKNLIKMDGVNVGTTIRVPYNKQGEEFKGEVIEIVLGENNTVLSMTENGRDIDESEYDEYIVGLATAGRLDPSAFTIGDTGKTISELQPRPFDPEEEMFFVDPYDKYSDTEEFPETPIEGYDEKVHYVKDVEVRGGDTRKAIVVGVPPRPQSGLFSEFRRPGMDGQEKEDILSGKIPVPRDLKPSQWDELFGETHNRDGSPKDRYNPDGSPKVSEALKESVDKPTESGILDLRNYKTVEEKDEAFDALPIGGLYYDDDGSGPFPKGRERNG